MTDEVPSRTAFLALATLGAAVGHAIVGDARGVMSDGVFFLTIVASVLLYPGRPEGRR